MSVEIEQAVSIPDEDRQVLLEAKEFADSQKDFQVGSEGGLAVAASLLAQAKDRIKKIKAAIEQAIQPCKEIKRELDSQMKELKIPYEVALEALEAVASSMNRKVLEFNRQLENKRLAAQAELDRKFEKDQMAAIAESVERQVAPAMPTHTVLAKVDTNKEFGIQIRRLQTYNIPGVVIEGTPIPNAILNRTNKALQDIPNNYFVLDVKALAQAHRSKNCVIPGTQHAVKEITAG